MTNGVMGISLIAGSIAALHAAWWLLLALLALRCPSRRLPSPHGLRIAVVVPAHNESACIGRTLASLLAAEGSRASAILVVADNCSDDTAAVARTFGVTVLERNEPTVRGKSHALDFALAYLRSLQIPPEAVAFVDADSTVSGNFLARAGGRIGDGAKVVQVHYAVAPGESSLVRLRRLAFALAHWARPLGASRLGLGTTLKGNGMVLRWELVQDGFAGAGLAEDAAMTLALARRGIAVDFEPRATVWGEMAATYRQATVQDQRWEAGRFSLMSRALLIALRAAIRLRFRAAAGALEVASLPLTVVGLLALVPMAAVATGSLPASLAVSPLAVLGASVLTGWLAARVSRTDLAALITAPRFLAHKLRVLATLSLHRGPREWQRTARD